MLLNVSYHNKETIKKIDAKVGKPFTLWERWKMRGIGSPRLVLKSMSIQISNLMELDSNRNVCNIEMRPDGIIIGFRSRLEVYALVIPYYKLVLFKGKSDEYTIHKNDYFFKIEARKKDTAVHRFMKKVMEAKARALPEAPQLP